MEAPKKWRFRFGMRSLFAFITIGCVALGWVSYQRHWTALRRAALAADGIQGNPNSKHSIYDKPYSPNWLWLFGEKGQSDVLVFVDLVGYGKIPELQQLFPEASIHIRLGEAKRNIVIPPLDTSMPNAP